MLLSAQLFCWLCKDQSAIPKAAFVTCISCSNKRFSLPRSLCFAYGDSLFWAVGLSESFRDRNCTEILQNTVSFVCTLHGRKAFLQKDFGKASVSQET